MKTQNRAVLDLSLTVLFTIALTALSFSINFIDRLRAFLVPTLNPSTFELLVNLVFFLLCGLLLLTYRRCRKALFQQKELENIISDINPDVLMVVDSDRNIIMCNASVERLFGYEVDEVVGQKTEFLYCDRRTNSGKKREVFEALERQGFHIGLATGKKKNGKTVPLEIVTGNLRGRDGAVLMFRDITGRAQAMDALKESQEKWRSLVENSPDIILNVDRNGTILFLNQVMSGLNKEDVFGKKVYDYVPHEYHETMRQCIARVFKTGEADSYTTTGVGPNGRISYYQSRVEPVKRDGQVISVNLIATDITERKRAEDELREYQENLRERTSELEQAYKELKKLDQMKDEFLSSVSHELRTPLTSIRSFSEILLHYNDGNADNQKEFLEIINTESERLTRLINDFLDLSKIEAGRMLYNDDLVSLKEIIEEATKSQQQFLKQKSIQVDVDICSELPFVFADRDRIRQVITNLLANAIKFSYEGGQIEFRTETFEGKRSGEIFEWIKVSVHDQGIGIEEKDLEIIFDKFRQASNDTLTDKPKGTGLGLPICKEIISHYGGNIWVESQKGKGAAFFFTLPSTAIPAQAIEKTLSGVEETTGWKGKTILVADDNPYIRKVLRYHLQRRGYTVLEASDGAEVMGNVQKTHIDLITLGLIMPTVNGYDILGMIREDPRTKSIPVLIVSMVEDKKRGILLGANDYLVKPFKEEGLIEKVQSLLGKEKRAILVVDDEPAVLETLRMQLEDRGYPVDVACDGQEALNFMKSRIPDLVILDVVMPKKNGYEVLSWIRNQPHLRDLPVIILSGQKLSGEREKLFSLGIDAYVEKTEGMDSLFERIDSMIISSDS